MPKSEKRVIPTRSVRLEVFDIHGHCGDKPLDYQRFFSFIASLPSQKRREQVGDRVIVVPTFMRRGPLYVFSAYMGSPNTSFLVVDLNNGEEEVRSVERGKIVATRTIGVIDPRRRIAVVQFARTGVRAQQAAAIFEKLAQNMCPEFAGATLEFAPRPGEEFRRRMLGFERIQSVRMTLTRPNYEWTDYPDALNGLAADSNAHNVSVAASASRSAALSKSKGVVKVLKELISGHGRSILKSAEVHGNAEGEDFLTILRLNNLSESKTVNVPTESGLPVAMTIQEAAMAYLGEIEGHE